ncbi:MAG: putative holin-like toxin [[Clostridium] symbiosum]|nr:putative holin-like toxin [[Clostridium] symbiosum]MDM8134892.1 putative holin-like toxin [[Clostridium] symbiosum]MDM8319198.1 putative holin-like toxin [[Clostridium] symbiosum]
MSTYETLSLMIAFGVFIDSIQALS